MTAGRVSRHVKSIDFAIFLGHANMINIKLYMMVLYIEFHLYVPLSMTLTILQGHSSVKQFQLKVLSFYLTKMKLYTLIYCVDSTL